jgi:hypothetical protein
VGSDARHKRELPADDFKPQKNLAIETKVNLNRQAVARASHEVIASGVAADVVAARRLSLRVTTPLASTAIFHLITSF